MSTTVSRSDDTPASLADGFPHVPGYEIIRVLGRGGMGCVYLARDHRLSREVAIKTLFPGADPSLVERFRTEVTAVAAIRHPNVLPVHHAGEAEGRPYFVMEYVEGGTLAQALDGKPIPAKDAAGLLEPVARAIQHCHEHGILHRDLKPGNILLANSERGTRIAERDTVVDTVRIPSSEFRVPMVADFGLAKRMEGSSGLTRTGDIMGTPAYMAPEQATGVVSQLGPGVDIYALGAILYEALTGRPPFQSPDPLNTLMMVISMDPIPPRQLQPRLPRDIDTICLKCLEKSPRKRYASGADLADDLRRFLDGRPIVARPIRMWEKATKWAKRRPAWAALAGVSVVALAVIVIGGAVYSARLKRSNDRLHDELDRSEQMFQGGHQLARYLVREHTEELTRLKGSTAAQKALIEKLLPYLDQLAAQMEGHELALGDVTLPELAGAYERLAKVQGFPGQVNLGDTPGARATFFKALALRRGYRTAHPDDQAVTIDLARCVVMIAGVDGATGDRLAARNGYTEALELLHGLPADGSAGGDRWQIEQDARYGLADLRIADGDRAGGLADLKELIPILRQAAKDRPESWITVWNLAQVLGHVAELETNEGDLPAAKAHYHEALDLSANLANSSRDDIRFLRELAINFLGYGDLLVDDKDLPEAIKAYEAATKILRGLAKADPDGKSIRRDLAIGLEKWGRGLSLAHQTREAVPLLEESLGLVRDQWRDDPTHRQKRRAVGIALTSLGWAYGGAENVDGQRRCFSEALELAEADKDASLVAELHLFLAMSIQAIAKRGPKEARLADLLTAIHHFDASRTTFDDLAKAGPLTPAQGRLRKAAETFRAQTQKDADVLKVTPTETKKP